MRLVACAFSAVLLSGCSWLGMGGGYGDSYGYNQSAGAAYGGGCGQSTTYTEVYVPLDPYGCMPGQGYGVAHSGGGHAGHGASGGFGQAGYGQGAQAGYGYGAQQGVAYGAQGGYGMGATTLGSSAPYGVAAYGGSAYTTGVETVETTVQSGQLYAAQPYAVYGGYQTVGHAHGGGALRLGLEAGIGTEIGLGGNVFNGEVSKPFLSGPGVVSDLAPIAYADAFDNAMTYDLAATYDVNRNTTLTAQVGYSTAEGQNNKVGTVTDGAALTEDLFAEFSDLEQIRLEGGLRRYMGRGGHAGLRPYVGASAGFVLTNDVELTQSSASLVDPALFTQNYIDGGWHPTAAGIVGAEWQVGARSALGFETGLRWTSELDTNLQSDAQWSVPLKLRGRVSF